MSLSDKIDHLEVRLLLTSLILDFVEELPDLDKRVFVLKHYGTCHVEEIARKLGYSRLEAEKILRQTEAALLHRARIAVARTTSRQRSGKEHLTTCRDKRTRQRRSLQLASFSRIGRQEELH